MGAMIKCYKRNSHPHALADAWLPSHNPALDGRVLVRLAGQAHVEDLLQQRRVEPAHKKRVVGGDRPAEAIRQQQMPACAPSDVATADCGHHLADVLRSRQCTDITQRMNCTTTTSMKQQGSERAKAAWPRQADPRLLHELEQSTPLATRYEKHAALLT